MRRLALLLVSPMLLSAADPIAVARVEADAAEREMRRLEKAAGNARSEADKLRAQVNSAAVSIVASEARLQAAEIRYRSILRTVEQRRRQLREQQRPAALLLAGVVQMGRRPPLLALADGGSPRELVIARALIDHSIPVIHARTASLRHQLQQDHRLAKAAMAARAEIARTRDQLRQRQQRFAALETRANARAAELGGELLTAGDAALARSSEADRLAGGASAQRQAGRLAAELTTFPPAPARPTSPADEAAVVPLAWRSPVAGELDTGLFEVSPSGVRSRGLTFASARGAKVVAPAAGRIAFAGPFRAHDGVVIINHGRGWMTLLTGVRTQLGRGASIRIGDDLGRALGPVTAELSLNGRPQPAALIAGSSDLLSNGRKSS